ncbi:hypothetical protein [Flavihumibacter sp.]|uniref:hypothetical protein n=1 Tax=Flavihumibacter sp. TaxID=1913981 RepID=UPI002FCA3CBD
MRPVFLCFLTLFSCALHAQLLNGTWKGLGWTSCESAYVELKLTQTDNIIRGESLYIFGDNRFQRYSLEGSYSPLDSVIILKEIKLLGAIKPAIDVNCFSMYSFRISESSLGTQLKGSAENRSRGLLKIKCADAEYELTKFIPSPLPVPGSPAFNADAAYLKMAMGRSDFTVRSLEIDNDSILVKLYDNGQVDGDTVSLIFNGQPIAVRVPITASMRSFTIYPDRNLEVNKLSFIAHNLGSIPPNTGTLTMIIDGKLVQVFLSADLSRNATIEFRWPQKD